MVNTLASCLGNLYDRCVQCSLALFLAAFVSFTKILFLADLMLANLYTSKYNMKFKCRSCVPTDSDTDAPLEHTHSFYANWKGLSIHILRNIEKTTVTVQPCGNGNVMKYQYQT